MNLFFVEIKSSSQVLFSKRLGNVSLNLRVFFLLVLQGNKNKGSPNSLRGMFSWLPSVALSAQYFNVCVMYIPRNKTLRNASPNTRVSLNSLCLFFHVWKMGDDILPDSIFMRRKKWMTWLTVLVFAIYD